MYERNYELLRAKFSEFFLPTLFTSMAGNICLFVDGLIVTFLLGAGNLSAIQIVAPVITFVNLIYWMIGLGGSVLCSVSKAEFDDEKSNSPFDNWNTDCSFRCFVFTKHLPVSVLITACLD